MTRNEAKRTARAEAREIVRRIDALDLTLLRLKDSEAFSERLMVRASRIYLVNERKEKNAQ